MDYLSVASLKNLLAHLKTKKIAGYQLDSSELIYNWIFLRWYDSTKSNVLIVRIEYEKINKNIIIQVADSRTYPIAYAISIYKEPEDPNKGLDTKDLFSKITRIIEFIVEPTLLGWKE